MKNQSRLLLLFSALLTILLATPLPLRAQDDDILDRQASMDDAWLSIHIDPLNRARFGLGVPLRIKDREQLQHSLSQTLRFPVQFNPPIVATFDEKEELDELAAEELKSSQYWTTITGKSPSALTDNGMRS